MLNEVKRLQQLAGILKENYDMDSYMDSEETEFEPELDEMARTAGTGGAMVMTDAGKQAYKNAAASIKAGKNPEGMREMWFRILRWMSKNEGKRLQKVDFAREELGPNVPQPRVNPFFNQLIEKGWIVVNEYDAYTGDKKPASSGGKDWASKFNADDFGDL